MSRSTMVVVGLNADVLTVLALVLIHCCDLVVKRE